MGELDTLAADALARVAASSGIADLDEIRVHWLGKKGVLTEQLKGLGALPVAERPSAGARINALKVSLHEAIEARRGELERGVIAAELARGAIDVTLPGRGEHLGGVHPITLTRLRIEEIFRRAGFSVEEGPEIANDFYTYEALNIPANHPARAMHDPF